MLKDDVIAVSNEEDIAQLDKKAGNFHDAVVERWTFEGNTVYVKFDGIWNCKIELWFSGEVSCSVCALTPEGIAYDWFGSTMFFENGFLYFNSERGSTAKTIENACCWFKARNLHYRVIPDL